MSYAVGDKVIFKVQEVKRAGGNLYFVIRPGGIEQDVKAFDFQRGIQLPFNLECYCRALKENGEPVFFQDIARIIPQLYKIGENYEFRIKNETPTGGYYEVIDNNGLVFRLSDFGGAKLHVNQVVTCQVKSINLVRMDLKLVSEFTDRGIQLLSFDQVLSLAKAEDYKRILGYIFSQSPVFAEAYRQYQNDNALWVLTALEAADRYMSQWPKKRYLSKRQNLEWLNRLSIALLEQSNYLATCTEREGFEYQEKLSRLITHFQDYIEAIDMIAAKQDTNYISDLLDRMKLTGYLYRPEKRMRIAMAIFSLQRKNVSHFINDIFDIIQQSHNRRHFMHLFSQAFVELLDAYITNESKMVDHFTTDADSEALNQMVVALALRLLLSRSMGDENNPTLSLYRSMLYRYATLLTQNNPQLLLLKARMSLLGISTDNLEFAWNDLSNIKFLCAKLGYDTGTPCQNDPRIFEGNNIRALFDGQSLSLMPLQHGANLYEAIGKESFASFNIRILLNDKLIERPSEDIEQLHRMWNEIEASIFSGIQVQSSRNLTKPKKKPKLGDDVFIRVIKNVFNDRFSFICRIEDENYEGEGILGMRQVVKYNINTTVNDFLDPKSGEPLLLKARVIDIDLKGRLRFGLLENVAKFLQDNLMLNSLVVGEIVKVDPHFCFAVSEGGYATYIPTNEVNETFALGDLVEVKIDNVNNEANVRGMYRRKIYGEKFDRHEAFLMLINLFAEGKTYSAPATVDIPGPTIEELQNDDTEGDAKSADSFLEPDFMRELIHIVDRQAIMCKDYLQTYNFLALAKMMSQMMSDAVSTEYFAKRMELVELIQQFGVNESIDEAKLDELVKENHDFMESYPDIKNKMLQLKSISLLGKDTDMQFLLTTAQESNNARVSEVAKYVLGYNLLKDANLHEALKAVERKIYQTMELNRKLPQNNFVAIEDQFTELKTSLIYPADKANHMRPNEKTQMLKIMRVVASMLNSKGGRLYIGVNDTGYATGLENDFIYLNNRHHDYDIVAIKDKFDRKFRDAVHNMLGHEANSLVEGTFEAVGSNIIYKVDIQPSGNVVFLEDVAYERQGSSIWPVNINLLPAFAEKRKKLIES